MPNSRFYDNLAGFSDLKYEAGNLYGRLDGGNYILIPTRGEDGDSAYVYHAFASDSSGTGFTLIDDGTLAWTSWITTNTPIANPSLADFTVWVRRKGIDGTNGANGTDGTSAYVYVAWASDSSGTGFSLTPSASLPYRAELHTSTPIVSPTLADFTGVPFVNISGGGSSPVPIGSIFMYPLTTPPNGAYLLNGQTISNCQSLYPSFWSWLNNAVTAGTVRTLSSADYEDELSVYGQCGAFVISGSAVRLPLINGFIQGLGTGTDKGATVAPGLPNITGNAPHYPTLAGSSWNGGALYGGTSAVNADISIAGGNASYKRVQIKLDASRANSIYGNSNTVQPPAIKYSYCIQVFNSATELSQQQSAQIATTLQGKADVNLGNLSAHTAIDANCPVDYVIYRGTGTNTWYRIWKSGWVEQGGQCKGTNASGHTTTTVSFPVAFADTKYCIFKNYSSDNKSTSTVAANVSFYDKTTTSAKTYNNGTSERDWYACGQGDSTDIAALLA